MAEPSKYRMVHFTCLEKKANGHKTGRYTKTFTIAHYGPGELDALINTLREDQQKKNDEFRGKRRAEKELAALETPKPRRARKSTKDNVATEEVDLEPAPEKPSKPLAGPACRPPEPANRIVLRLDRSTGNSTALLGSSKQGKSTCMMELFRENYSDADCIATLFATNPQIGLYKDPRLLVCPVYEPRVVKLAHAINRKTKNAYDFCFLLDDIVDKRDDNTLKQLLLTLRNSNLSSIVCLQYGNLLAKVARANVNNLLLFGFNSDEAIDLVCRQFLASHLREQKVPPAGWAQYYRDATRDHGFIYIHPSSGQVTYHRLRL
jgi:hypothetical protein